jgi:hypothetical protein
MTDSNISDDDAYRPPFKSTGVKMFAARSKSSVRGFGIFEMPAEQHPRQIIYESHLERKTLLSFCALPDIWNIHDQPARISYKGLTGRDETHLPDYLAQFRCGLRVAVAVKPFERAQKINFRATLRAVRKCMSPNFADRLVLVTEKNLRPAEVQNAEFLHLCRQHKDPEADLAIANAAARFGDEISILELVKEAGLQGRGFRAVFRAIYSGGLHADRQKKITTATVISVGETRPC